MRRPRSATCSASWWTADLTPRFAGTTVPPLTPEEHASLIKWQASDKWYENVQSLLRHGTSAEPAAARTVATSRDSALWVAGPGAADLRHQAELLLPPGCLYRTTGIRRDGDLLVLSMKVIQP